MKLTLLLFFSVFSALAQNINGKILETETNKPIEYVNVYLEKDESGTISNEKGEFNLELNSKIKPTDTIRFSIIGYTTKYHTFSKLKELNFIVNLSKKTENLNEVTVTSKRELKSTIPYKKLSSLKKGIYCFGSTLIDNKIFVIGGDKSFIEDAAKQTLQEVSYIPEATFLDFIKKSRSNFSWEKYNDELQTYNIEKDTWLISNLKFRNRAYHKIIYFNNKVYVLGGKTLSKSKEYQYLDNKIEVFNLNTNQIVVDNVNPHQAINFAAFAYLDNIIVMGGSIKLKNNGEKIYSDETHLYNITSGYWYELPKMTKPKEVNGIIIKDKIYLVGGFNKTPLTEIESYDLTNGKWNKEGDLFSGIEAPALTYCNNIIYIFSNGKILTYNIVTKVLNEYKIELYVKGSQMHYYQDNLYILGGFKEYDYTKSPSANFSLIKLNDFSKTKIINSKKFN
ncbi:Kelch repeat-containing protein [Abyssalbus ytuae]|uniref:Carboxypeptidase-like regulatory domain-containing protein n=1 Tax=Abyssalbus ytuae TaxID=2926907 RepID=A0A9E6ZU34_9FLAO|nr:carboxypeptidase-like regulatory domain-containing protein [Abyssalbus ytuae]UOB18933.1 carboxypeptidase-like regulatory domain-containing protein [Abyssalbus ytuae]